MLYFTLPCDFNFKKSVKLIQYIQLSVLLQKQNYVFNQDTLVSEIHN